MLLYHKLNIGIYIYCNNEYIYIYVLWLRIYVYTVNSPSPWSIPVVGIDSPQVDTHDPRRGPIRW